MPFFCLRSVPSAAHARGAQRPAVTAGGAFAGVMMQVVLAAGMAAGLAVAGESAAKTPEPLPQLGYHPHGMAMWDAWFIEHQGKAHMFHLQRLMSGSSRTAEEASRLGHAVSDDLLTWTEMPLGLAPGPAGSLDDMQPWTGSVVEHDGAFKLFYTMRAQIDKGARQRTGLAISSDLSTWVRYAGNPIMEPDPRWYASAAQPDPGGVVDCRDLVVIKEPDRASWLGFYAARTPAAGLAEGSVIAVVRSTDLVHWEHLPPAYAPKKYACLEVPDVYTINGKWYLTMLTGHEYGNRGYFSDPHVTRGTIYAIADRPEGPYREFANDNVLLGGDHQTGYSCRTFLFKGERVLLNIQGVPGGPAQLSPPMSLRADAEGHLRVTYAAHNAGWRRKTLADGQLPAPSVTQIPSHYRWTMPAGQWTQNARTYRGTAAAGWHIASLGLSARQVEIAATVQIDRGTAVGLAWGPMNNGQGKDFVIMLDADAQCVRAGFTPHFSDPFVRRQVLERGRPYHLRAVIRPPRFEVYLDDHLVLQSAFPVTNPIPASAQIGLFVDRADAVMSGLEIHELGIKP